MDFLELEKGILITDLIAAGDGGSLVFVCETFRHVNFEVMFVQHVFLENSTLERLSGRMYLNGEIIELKSKEEKCILTGFSNFSLSEELKKNESINKMYLIDTFKRLTHFYHSNASLEIKKKVDNLF